MLIFPVVSNIYRVSTVGRSVYSFDLVTANSSRRGSLLESLVQREGSANSLERTRGEYARPRPPAPLTRSIEIRREGAVSRRPSNTRSFSFIAPCKPLLFLVDSRASKRKRGRERRERERLSGWGGSEAGREMEIGQLPGHSGRKLL